MVSFVNGYTCFTSCDVAAAKQGHDPSKPAGTPPDGPRKSGSSFDKHATVFGGALQALMTGKTGASGGSDPNAPDPNFAARPSVDIVV